MPGSLAPPQTEEDRVTNRPGKGEGFLFRRKKTGNEEGYERIQRIIEERQRQLEAGGHGESVQPLQEEEEGVLFQKGGRAATPAAKPASSSTVTMVPPPEPPAPVSRPSFAATLPPELEAPPLPAMEPPATGTATVIGKDARWEGTLTAERDVRIEGSVTGEVRTQATLFVASDARVEGTVRAADVVLAGAIHGEIHCSGKLEVLPGGAAHGEVHTGRLVIHEGAFIDSKFEMQRDGTSPRRR